MTDIKYLNGAIDAGGCISSAWNLVTRNFWLYIGLGLLTMLFLGCIPFAGFFLFGPLMGGFYYLVLRDMRDEPVDFGMLFKGFEKFLPLMIVGLIQSAPSIVVTILQYTVDIARIAGTGSLPGTDGNFYQSGTDALFAGFSAAFIIVVVILSLFGVVWSVALSFAVPLVMEQDAPVADALTTSAKAALNNAGGLIGLIVLEILVGLLGLLALCLGLFVALPVVYAANVFAYRQVFPYLNSPHINTTPPLPSEYGGTYGTNY